MRIFSEFFFYPISIDSFNPCHSFEMNSFNWSDNSKPKHLNSHHSDTMIKSRPGIIIVRNWLCHSINAKKGHSKPNFHCHDQVNISLWDSAFYVSAMLECPCWNIQFQKLQRNGVVLSFRQKLTLFQIFELTWLLQTISIANRNSILPAIKQLNGQKHKSRVLLTVI